MAGAHIDVDFGEFTERIGTLLTRIDDAEPVLASFGEYLIGEHQDRFDREVDPEGNRWADLAPETWARKRIPKILTETSTLRDDVVYDAGKASLAIGTNVEYGAVHQFGADFSIMSTRRRVKIPARPYIGVTPADVEELHEMLKEYLGDDG